VTADEAADLIDAIADSIEANPSQFHFSLTVVGTRATASGPGSTGIVATAIGGEAGSSAIGFQSSVSSGDVEIAAGTANAAATQEMREVVAILRELAVATANGTGASRRGLLARLQQSAVVPAMVIELTTLVFDLAKIAH